MKLATYKDASRDGQLVVVSRDLSTAHYATGIASYVERLSKVPGSAIPPSLYAEPLLRQGASDCFIGPCDDVALASEAFGIDFEAQLAVITGDVPMGASPEQALDGIRLLVSHLCQTRPVSAGSIIGAGPVSHPDWGQGYSCIAEKRAVETADNGKPETRFMKFCDTLRIEVKGRNGQSLFGAIEQEVTPLA